MADAGKHVQRPPRAPPRCPRGVAHAPHDRAGIAMPLHGTTHDSKDTNGAAPDTRGGGGGGEPQCTIVRSSLHVGSVFAFALALYERTDAAWRSMSPSARGAFVRSYAPVLWAAHATHTVRGEWPAPWAHLPVVVDVDGTLLRLMHNHDTGARVEAIHTTLRFVHALVHSARASVHIVTGRRASTDEWAATCAELASWGLVVVHAPSARPMTPTSPASPPVVVCGAATESRGMPSIPVASLHLCDAPMVAGADAAAGVVAAWKARTRVAIACAAHAPIVCTIGDAWGDLMPPPRSNGDTVALTAPSAHAAAAVLVRLSPAHDGVTLYGIKLPRPPADDDAASC